MSEFTETNSKEVKTLERGTVSECMSWWYGFTGESHSFMKKFQPSKHYHLTNKNLMNFAFMWVFFFFILFCFILRFVFFFFSFFILFCFILMVFLAFLLTFSLYIVCLWSLKIKDRVSTQLRQFVFFVLPAIYFQIYQMWIHWDHQDDIILLLFCIHMFHSRS